MFNRQFPKLYRLYKTIRMIILLPRKEILQKNTIISAEITKIQQVFYDEDILQLYEDTHEESLFWEPFDHYHEEVVEYKAFSKVIGLQHTNIDSYTNKLANKLNELFSNMDITEYYIMSHLKLDFFGNRDINCKPLRQSYKKLEAIVNNDSYNEAFSVSAKSLEQFIEILFWMARYDANTPEFVFIFDSKQRFSFNICRYGNLHLTEYNVEHLTEKKLKDLGWTIFDGEEVDQFNDHVGLNGQT